MPKWITALFAFFLSISLLDAKARTVEDVMNIHIRALGGKAALRANRTNLKPYSLYNEFVTGKTVKLEGISKVNNKPCFQLRVLAGDDMVAKYFIDAENGYLLQEKRTTTSGGNGVLVIEYSGYKKNSNGLLFPEHIIVTNFPPGAAGSSQAIPYNRQR